MLRKKTLESKGVLATLKQARNVDVASASYYPYGYVFRTDHRHPGIILDEGFKPKGSNHNLESHFEGYESNSAYIAYSASLTSSVRFASLTKSNWLYKTIQPTITVEMRSSMLLKHMWDQVKRGTLLNEDEKSGVGAMRPSDILLARQYIGIPSLSFTRCFIGPVYYNENVSARNYSIHILSADAKEACEFEEISRALTAPEANDLPLFGLMKLANDKRYLCLDEAQQVAEVLEFVAKNYHLPQAHYDGHFMVKDIPAACNTEKAIQWAVENYDKHNEECNIAKKAVSYSLYSAGATSTFFSSSKQAKGEDKVLGAALQSSMPRL